MYSDVPRYSYMYLDSIYEHYWEDFREIPLIANIFNAHLVNTMNMSFTCIFSGSYMHH